jgi:hypothetical protein
VSPSRERRLFAACGVIFVLLELVGFGLGGSTHQLTVSSSAAKIATTLATPAQPVSWIGAYLNILSFGAFLAFATWTCATLGGGLLGTVGRAMATSYATLSIASLAVMNAVAYRAGHGLNIQLARALITTNEALFVGTWFLAAFFLLATGSLALQGSRPLLGWSALAVALFTLLATALSVTGIGQLSILLFFAWIISASISLSRGPQTYQTAAAEPARA